MASMTFHEGAQVDSSGLEIDVSRYGSIVMQIESIGVMSATVTWQAMILGTWTSIRAQNLSTGEIATTATAVGLYLVPAGVYKMRAVISSWASGAIKISGTGFREYVTLSGGSAATVSSDVSDRAARDLGKVDVAGIDAVGAIAGQKAMAASFPVVEASDSPSAVAIGTTADAAVVTDAVGTLSSKLRGLIKWAFERMPAALGQAAMTASLPVAIANNQSAVAVTPGAQEVHLGEIGGPHSVASDTFARPANTTLYTVKDVCGNAGDAANLTFTNVARVAAGSGIICKARLMSDNKDLAGRYRLHLFNAAPTPIADNSPYLLLYANAAARIGEIDYDAMSTEDLTNSTASKSLNTSVRLPFTCAAASRNLHGILEVLDAYTPVSGTNYYVEIESEVN